MLRTYRDLVAWQNSFDLCTTVYGLTPGFPPEERFGLTAQIRRSAVSVPSNIAEGYSRGMTRDYVRFLRTAKGSLCELETQILLAKALGFIAQAAGTPLLDRIRGVSRILAALVASLERKAELPEVTRA